MAKQSRSAKLPKQIFITRVHDDRGIDEPWLDATETTDGVDDGTLVGVYELRETRTMKVTRELK